MISTSSPSPPASASLQNIKVILEGELSFDNGKIIKSYSKYWAQILEETDGDNALVTFKIYRNKKKGGKQEIKRRVVLFNEDDGFKMPAVNVASNVTDFTMTVSADAVFKLRAESSGVREQWLAALANYCEFPGCERLVSTNKAAQLGTGKHTFEEKYVHFRDFGLDEPMVSDCDMVRVAIPGDTVVKVTMSLMVKLLKDAVGKDLSRFSMPVFVNEPTSVLMKTAELMSFNDNLTAASQQTDSTRRMLYNAITMATQFYCFHKRSGKPFNPLLGETYELVTPKFRYFSEMVAHHPPMGAFCCQGDGYEIMRTTETVQKFNGKQVHCQDNNVATINLFVGPNKVKETYKAKSPTIVVGNLFVGERFVEPQGEALITCEDTGDRAEIKFKKRGITSTKKDENYVKVSVKNKHGEECYTIEGKYTEDLYAKDLATGEQWLVFTAPPKPANHEVMYQMNLQALQLMVMSDELKAKLPPTDGRLRGDLRHWDVAALKPATAEKDRLENNQRQRRAKVKQLIKEDPAKQADWNVSDERTFYTPTFFQKNVTVDAKGNKKYLYEPIPSQDQPDSYLYWEMRDQNNWKVPRIFEDDCEPFY